MSREAVPKLNQCIRVGTNRDWGSFVVQRRCCGRPLCANTGHSSTGWRTGQVDPLLSFPISPGTGDEHHKAGVGPTGRMRQSTKSLRSSPLRGGGSRQAGSKPIG